MKRKSYIAPLFILLFISFLLFFFKSFFLKSFFENIFIPLSGIVPKANESTGELGRLKRENQDLQAKLAELETLRKENHALNDQFQTTNPRSQSLLPAHVVGAPSFIPGVSLPEKFIIDKGKKDGVKKGLAVVVQNSILGQISNVSDHLSEIQLVSFLNTSFTAKTLVGNVQGIVKGRGNGQIALENVILSDTLKKDDIVVTYGSTTLEENGLSEGLIVGKIVSIEKKPSNLFQSAQIKSLIQIPQVSTVFIILN